MTTSFTRRVAAVAVSAVAFSIATSAASAQQANPSVTAFGMGNTNTAYASGYETIGWNPALLGLSGRPSFSIGGLIVGSAAGIGPIKVEDFADYSGKQIPTAVRQGWIARVRSNGKQAGNIDAGVTFVAFSAGRFAMSLSGSAAADMNFNGDALELVLLGNGDAVAQNRTLSPSGKFTGSAFVTTAASWSTGLDWKPTGMAGEEVSFGITGKYVLGAAHVTAKDNGSTLTPNNLALRFPVVRATGNAGNGIGADIGAAWRAGHTTLGLNVTNVFNSFAWSEGEFTCTDISTDITANATNTNTDDVACTNANVRPAVEAAKKLKFMPGVHAGWAWDAKKTWAFTVDAAAQMGNEGEAILIGPKTSIGVGTEFRGIPFLPLRAGASVITGGTQFSGGAGLRIGSYELGVGAQMRTADGVSSTNLMFGLFSIR